MSSFTRRLTLIFSVLVTLTTAVLLLLGGWLLHGQLIRSMEDLHTIEGEELQSLITAANPLSEREVARIVEVEADSDAALFFIQIHHASGRVLFRSENLGEAILPSPVAEHDSWTAQVPELGAVRISEFRHGPWHIQVASRLTPVRRVLRDYARVSALLVAGAAGVSVAIGYVFSRITLQPIRAIEATARRIRADSLGERIPVPPGSDELAALTRLLNQMFDRLEISFRETQQFTANASHELKTPLALIRLNADKLRHHVAEHSEAVRALDDISEEVERLNQIIESLLFLARAEGGVLTMQQQLLDVPSWLRAFSEDAVALAEDRGVRFTILANEPGQVKGEPHLLRHLLLNVVSNAVAVSPPGSTVTLESRRTRDRWLWTISDEGPGLAPSELERIFERFARTRPLGDFERAGNGLGLAICRSIARLHGGRVWAENRTDRSGLRIRIDLPADANAA